MRISDWSSDVCSSDLHDLADVRLVGEQHHDAVDAGRRPAVRQRAELEGVYHAAEIRVDLGLRITGNLERLVHDVGAMVADRARRSEEPTSELQSLMRISYAVFCLTKKRQTRTYT